MTTEENAPVEKPNVKQDSGKKAPAGERAGPGAPIRLSRVLSMGQLTTIGMTISLGLAVFTILGPFVEEHPAQSIQGSFLLLALIALPIVLTLGDYAMLSKGRGVYGLVRNAEPAILPFLTGWLMLGGFSTLLALLSLGLAAHVDILLASINIGQPVILLGALLLILLTGVKILGGRTNWQHGIFIATAAALTAFVLAMLGLFRDPTGISPARYLSRDALKFGVSVTETAALFGAALWGSLMIIELRGYSSNRVRLRNSLLVTIASLTIVAGTAALALDHHRGPFANMAAPLLTFAQAGIAPAPGLFQVVYLLAGFWLMLMGIDLVFTNNARVSETMADDGFAPGTIVRQLRSTGAPIWPTVISALIGLLLMQFVPLLDILRLSSAFFFWTIALINFPRLIARPDSAYVKGAKLPFHPLLPGLALTVSILLPLTLGGASLLQAAIWPVVGLIAYFAYARGRENRERQKAIQESEKLVGFAGGINTGSYPPMENAVLVGISNPKTSRALLRLGARLAAQRDTGVIALRVVRMSEQTALHLRPRIVQRELETLQEMLDEAKIDSVAVQPLVRLGVSPQDGIMDVIESEDISLLLLGWSGTLTSDGEMTHVFIDEIMRDAACDVLVLRGEIPTEAERIVIATAGGPHSILAAELSPAFCPTEETHIRLLHVLPSTSSISEKQTGNAALTAGANFAGEQDVEQEMISAGSIEEGIIKGSDKADLLVMGAAKTNAFTRSRFRGMPVHIGSNRAGAVLITRAREELRHPWLARAWETVSDPLPQLTEARRKEVLVSMVESSSPSVDYYVLIVLSAIIATLGLMQNSAAVIIGAMLVAPLMSPILAIAMGIVRGDLELLRTASKATAQGIFLAVLTGVITALLSPINAATNEILSRTQPNVLDLMVALASGAAAGYAVSRSRVAAALPGVAIAAALVPPLGVVGYGISASQLRYAGGSLLLFSTNLVAIVLSAALVFLALGFYPRDVGGQRLWPLLRIPLLLLAIITAALTTITVITVRNANVETEIERFLNDNIPPGELQTFVVTQAEDEYQVQLFLLPNQPDVWTPDFVNQLDQKLEEVIGRQADVEAIIQPAERYRSGEGEIAATVTDYLNEQIEANAGRVVQLNIFSGEEEEIRVVMTVLTPPDRGLDAQELERIRRGLTERIRAQADGNTPNVHLEVTSLVGDYANLGSPSAE
ncbi:MAG: DUF389 domain-containing protein [Caldilineaceae bacterium]|nr:DUF389 domain-containing protein [Caldilineaceae bacterium]